MFSEVLAAARSLLLQEIYVDIYNIRFIKPIDEEYFLKIVEPYCGICFVEDGVEKGGISEALERLVLKNDRNKKTVIKALPDRFLAHGKRNEIVRDCGLDSESLASAIKGLL